MQPLSFSLTERVLICHKCSREDNTTDCKNAVLPSDHNATGMECVMAAQDISVRENLCRQAEQEVLDAYNAGAADLATALTQSTIETEALRERFSSLQAIRDPVPHSYFRCFPSAGGALPLISDRFKRHGRILIRGAQRKLGLGRIKLPCADKSAAGGIKPTCTTLHTGKRAQVVARYQGAKSSSPALKSLPLSKCQGGSA